MQAHCSVSPECPPQTLTICRPGSRRAKGSVLVSPSVSLLSPLEATCISPTESKFTLTRKKSPLFFVLAMNDRVA